jgi:Effector-associated domain 1/CHAT domain
MGLSSQQRRELHNALIDAFPDTTSLERMLSFELDKSLRVIAGEGSLQDIVFKLIQAANAQGWVEDLVRAAYNSNPGNSRLQAIAEELLPNHAPKTPSNISQKQNHQSQKILILAANPKGTTPLRLDEEVREIDAGLRRAMHRDRFVLEQKWAVRPRDIQRAMLDIHPSIVHFSGHGTGDEGLVFEDETGSSKLVDGEALAGLFELFADQVECVVLNGCYSEVQAEAIAQHVNYVIGMKKAIGDRAAIEFAVGFYDALGSGSSVEFAYKFGCAAIRLAGISEQLTPILKKKSTSF